jgi:hypothetical protein
MSTGPQSSLLDGSSSVSKQRCFPAVQPPILLAHDFTPQKEPSQSTYNYKTPTRPYSYSVRLNTEWPVGGLKENLLSNQQMLENLLIKLWLVGSDLRSVGQLSLCSIVKAQEVDFYNWIY